MGRVVSDVKDIKEPLLMKQGKDFSVMAGEPDKTRHPLFLQPQGSVNHPLAGPPGIITQYKNIRVFDSQIPQPAHEEPLGQKRTVRVAQHGYNKICSLAFLDDVPDGLSHGRGPTLDECPPGEVIAALLKGLFECLSRRTET